MNKNGINQLPKGKYVICDPCYTLGTKSNKEWNALLNKTGYFGYFKPNTDVENNSYNNDRGGYFKVQDKVIACFGTRHGDGSYYDQHGNEYGVDAGMIACIPIDIAEKIDNRLMTKHIFEETFICHYDDGCIHFGDIEIDTN
tara:strand:+ start:54 stop:479 length:426 start_codon:yes stop_codon:yes gene_type:complete